MILIIIIIIICPSLESTAAQPSLSHIVPGVARVLTMRFYAAILNPNHRQLIAHVDGADGTDRRKDGEGRKHTHTPTDPPDNATTRREG